MPEGPEVATFADDLNQLLKGKRVREYEYDPDFKHLKNIDQIKGTLVVQRVFSHGKKIIFSFENGSYLLSFLGLEGRWYLAEDENNLHSSTLFKLFFKGMCICYRDTRHFGYIEYIKDYDKLSLKLDSGLDILNVDTNDEDWNEVYEEAINRHRQELKICEFLMDQRYILGIGNYLRAEILYHAKIDPFKGIKSLTFEEKERIRLYSSQEIKKAYKLRGASLRTYKDFYGNSGKYEPVIYGNKISPDERVIERGKDKSSRTIWYCV